MNERCPTCGYRFERGPGYFTGAMYFSYALGIPVLVAEFLLGKLFLVPHWSFERIIGLAWLGLLPLTPAIFRYSRVLFIHLDRALDPEGVGD